MRSRNRTEQENFRENRGRNKRRDLLKAAETGEARFRGRRSPGANAGLWPAPQVHAPTAHVLAVPKSTPSTPGEAGGPLLGEPPPLQPPPPGKEDPLLDGSVYSSCSAEVPSLRLAIGGMWILNA
uniref:Uncharacterized protein n=1 Tax=Rangifer tarandus platyrhynchus TaxID=3082113 RepID=A0ACB0EET4_RANTA|nr:unnamed protein product [Rangifer tarandus platyrhynchus]